MRLYISLVALTFLAPTAPWAVPVLTQTVSQVGDLYHYEYVLSGIDPGRMVRTIGWKVIEGVGAPQPEYFPLVFDVPFFWRTYPTTEGFWNAGTAPMNQGRVFPINEKWGIAYAGQTRTFRFVTQYSPREGQYFLVESEADNYTRGISNSIWGTTLVPNYTGLIPEADWRREDSFNYPTTFKNPEGVPEPSSMILMALTLGGLGFSLYRKKSPSKKT